MQQAAKDNLTEKWAQELVMQSQKEVISNNSYLLLNQAKQQNLLK